MDENGTDRALVVQAYHTYEFDNSYAIDVALSRPFHPPTNPSFSVTTSCV
jgi:hypothetical protein